MTRTFVVPDAHGRHDLVAGLIAKAGVPTTRRERAEAGIVCVQLGDLANCVQASVEDDCAALALAREWFDVVLVGNHEWPYVNRSDAAFAGFEFDRDVAAGVKRLIDDRILKPCLLVGGTLLTHAGVAAGWKFPDARTAERAIRGTWRHELGAPILTACGRGRGGRDPHGGILWRHAAEPPAAFPQVHGHTPNRDGPQVAHGSDGSFVLNLDVGVSAGWAERGVPPARRIVGAWLDGDGGLEPDWLIDIRSVG